MIKGLGGATYLVSARESPFQSGRFILWVGREDEKMGIGKEVRKERIMNRETGKTVIVPMDHGVTVGPIKGLIDLPKTVDMVAKGGANAVVEHVGMVGKGHRR